MASARSRTVGLVSDASAKCTDRHCLGADYQNPCTMRDGRTCESSPEDVKPEWNATFPWKQVFISAMPEQLVELNALNDLLETYHPRQIVDWGVKEFGDGLVMSSSFGAESAVLIHMVTRILPRAKVVFVDTGFLFPETHSFMEELRHRFDLNVWVYRTQHDPIAYLREANESDPAHRRDVTRCCAINKNEPFERAMRQLRPTAWLRGIRRHQGESRASKQIVEWSQRYACYAVSRLMNWSRRDMYDYMNQHDLPYHPLFEKGYASIGCNPVSCTRPLQIGEDMRAGRWAGTSKAECGLHLENGAGI